MRGSSASWFGSAFRLLPTCKKALRVVVSSRDTTIWYLPVGPTSAQVSHGTGASPAVTDPAAMALSLASLPGLMFSVQAASSGWQAGTFCHLNPPGVLASTTPRTVKMRPLCPRSNSLQVTQGTALPVSANTPLGWAESRLMLTLRLGSLLALSATTSCQWKPAMAASSLTPLATNTCAKFETALSSSQTTHGTGGLVGSPEPGNRKGWMAGFFVSWFRLGMPLPRSCPAGCQAPEVALKRLAKTWVWPPKAALVSNQVTHGTVRSCPAKPSDGPSASSD